MENTQIKNLLPLNAFEVTEEEEVLIREWVKSNFTLTMYMSTWGNVALDQYWAEMEEFENDLADSWKS